MEHLLQDRGALHLSVATANLYFMPFEQALEIIAEAGFQYIELDLFWERKEWIMAQHLKGIPASQAIQMVKRSGLVISSIHDGGGVLERDNSILGFINPSLDETLAALDYKPECLVFHTPHIEDKPDLSWWEKISGKIARSLERYRNACSCITIENLPPFANYSVPLTHPEELKAFTNQHELGITLDTTHYAQMGTDIVSAARILSRNVRSIHLSDFISGRTHVYVGEGELNFSGFFAEIDKNGLKAITLECSFAPANQAGIHLNKAELVSGLHKARMIITEYM
ncbi:MAG TPA: sugar phosphate isomerase/epimerase [Anaerolineales bacterium]|nr:sugar phosphate isomerase/epimerase [Anaerolineales bacterium]